MVLAFAMWSSALCACAAPTAKSAPAARIDANWRLQYFMAWLLDRRWISGRGRSRPLIHRLYARAVPGHSAFQRGLQGDLGHAGERLRERATGFGASGEFLKLRF